MYFVTVVYLENHCFYSFLWYFFAPAAPETVREFNQQLRSQTGTSEEWNILTRKEIALVLCRDAPQARKFWVLRYHKQDFKCKNRVFESFLECFRSGNTWKYLKIFGLRPGLWLNPPLLKNVKIQGGGVKYKELDWSHLVLSMRISRGIHRNWTANGPAGKLNTSFWISIWTVG